MLKKSTQATLFSTLLILFQSATPAYETAKGIEQKFRPITQGWTGGDGIYSVSLGQRKLWVFGDTLIGSIKDKQRRQTRMIHNSIAIENQGNWKFLWHKKTLKDIFISPRSGHWFWPGPGIYHERELYLILPEFTSSPGAEGFGFKQTGVYLAHIQNPLDSPLKWKIHYQKLDWGVKGDSYSVTAYRQGKDWYIYGYADQNKIRVAKLLKVPLNDLKKTKPKPLYWTGQNWSESAEKSQALFSGYQSEGSAHFDPQNKKIQLIYTLPGLSDKVAVREADQPEGPWGKPQTIFRYPEMKDKRFFCYAAKHHPHLQKNPNEWVVGYACNGFKFEDVLKNPQIYVPRFVRIQYPKK